MKLNKKYIIILSSILAVFLTACLILNRRVEYDAVFLGKAETKMWKAYYTHNKFRLAVLLVQTLKQQFNLSTYEASETGKLFANAAMKFKNGRTDAEYEKDALPDLIAAYKKIKQYSSLSFNVEKVARAELAWWVYRRTPGKNDPKTVGLGIAHLYELIYNKQNEFITKSGLLRAEAAHLRDAGRESAQWDKIELMLIESYQMLQKGFELKDE